MGTGQRGGWVYLTLPVLSLLGAIAVWVIFVSGAFAQTPNPVTPGYQVCSSASGSTICSWQPVDATHGLPVNATVSASGFHAEVAIAPLAVTTVSATSSTFTAGKTVVVSNVGTTNTAYCFPGVVATTQVQPIAPNGGWFAFSTVNETTISCVTAAGTTTVNIAVGTGLSTGTGGGGSGGGGGLSVSDQTAWTQGSSAFTPTGGVFNDAATLSSGQEGTVRLTSDRQMKTLDSAVLAAVQSPIPAQTGIGNVNIGAVQSAGSAYETIAASQTAQVLGPTGATGDYLSHCVIYPTTTTPGVVTVFDNASAAGTNVIAFPGGASSVSNLAPIAIPVGALSTAGSWKVTTGANLVVTCYGKFT